MAQIVHARRAVAAAIDPSELLAKLLKNAVDLPIAKGLPEQFPACADEERRLGRGTHMQTALPSVSRQRLDSAGVQRHQSGLAELTLANRQHLGVSPSRR